MLHGHAINVTQLVVVYNLHTIGVNMSNHIIQGIAYNEFKSIKRPKIIISDPTILMSDPPFPWRIFLAVLFFILTIFSVESHNYYNDPWLIIICLSFMLLFVYDALSLKRVRIDFERKVISISSLNPVENLVNYILKRPSEISFSNIKKIYSGYTLAVARDTTRYYVYIRTDDLYNLKIGTFNKQIEANDFAAYLNRKIGSVSKYPPGKSDFSLLKG